MEETRNNLLIMLKSAQEKNGSVTCEYMTGLSRSLNVPLSDVYGVASFYSFLKVEPPGRNIIRVCKSLPCYLENSVMIIESIAQTLGIRPGQTTADGRFTLELTNCIGACDVAPAMLVNGDVHGNLTPQKIGEVLEQYE